MHSLRSLNIKQSRGGTDGGGREGGRPSGFLLLFSHLQQLAFILFLSCGEARTACMGKGGRQNESGDEYGYSPEFLKKVWRDWKAFVRYSKKVNRDKKTFVL